MTTASIWPNATPSAALLWRKKRIQNFVRFWRQCNQFRNLGVFIELFSSLYHAVRGTFRKTYTQSSCVVCHCYHCLRLFSSDGFPCLPSSKRNLLHTMPKPERHRINRPQGQTISRAVPKRPHRNFKFRSHLSGRQTRRFCRFLFRVFIYTRNTAANYANSDAISSPSSLCNFFYSRHIFSHHRIKAIKKAPFGLYRSGAFL